NTLESVEVVYDNCQFGKGRICQINDESGRYNFSYDAYGNTIEVVSEILGQTYVVSYSYDSDNLLSTIRLPSGREIEYRRDVLQRIQSIDTKVNAIQSNLLTAIDYRADGLLLSKTYANGIRENRSYDQQGRLLNQNMGGNNDTVYTYDPSGNLLSANDLNATTLFSYDQLHRLEVENSNNNVKRYTYDPNGNRLADDVNGTVRNFAYVPSTNQLIALDGQSFELDESGNIISDGQGRSFEYNDHGQLKKVSQNGNVIATYTYNAFGQRVIRQAGNSIIVYHYDLLGNLLSESTAGGMVQREYVWMERSPVAVVEGNGDTVFLQSDRMETPRVATGSGGSIVWMWHIDAFGNINPIENNFALNLRFPGQYYDSETGLLYNWTRYYEPALGRYISVDFMGLDGGINPYVYALDNPLVYVDPDGRINIVGGIVGALVNTGFQVAANYIANGGDLSLAFRCVNLVNVGTAFAAGLIFPGAGSVVTSAVRNGVRSAATRTAAVGFGRGAALKFGANLILPDYRPGGCECEGKVGLPGVANALF
ncbi:MAG: RHS repeat-associated core domain-containing protein, partial [Gammaproteobacteria bacterium]